MPFDSKQCKICLRDIGINNFRRHINSRHNIDVVEYWQKHVDPSITGLCKAISCNAPVGFRVSEGFNEYCSLACCYSAGSPRNQKIGAFKEGKTYEEMYGLDTAALINLAIGAKAEQWHSSLSKEQKQQRADKIRSAKLGVARPQEVKDKVSSTLKGKYLGEKNPNWKGGITELRHLICESLENRAWQNKVFAAQRCCRICSSIKQLHIHHIDGISTLIQAHGITRDNWRGFASILFNENNGAVLCNTHHNANNGISLHSVFGRKNITREHFDEYLLRFSEPEEVAA